MVDCHGVHSSPSDLSSCQKCRFIYVCTPIYIIYAHMYTKYILRMCKFVHIYVSIYILITYILNGMYVYMYAFLRKMVQKKPMISPHQRIFPSATVLVSLSFFGYGLLSATRSLLPFGR